MFLTPITFLSFTFTLIVMQVSEIGMTSMQYYEFDQALQDQYDVSLPTDPGLSFAQILSTLLEQASKGEIQVTPEEVVSGVELNATSSRTSTEGSPSWSSSRRRSTNLPPALSVEVMAYKQQIDDIIEKLTGSRPAMNLPAVELGWSSMMFYEVDQELQDSLNVGLPSNANDSTVAAIHAQLINNALERNGKSLEVTEAELLQLERTMKKSKGYEEKAKKGMKGNKKEKEKENKAEEKLKMREDSERLSSSQSPETVEDYVKQITSIMERLTGKAPELYTPAVELGWSSMMFYEVDQELQESLNASLPSNANDLTVAEVYAKLIINASALAGKALHVTETDLIRSEYRKKAAETKKTSSEKSMEMRSTRPQLQSPKLDPEAVQCLSQISAVIERVTGNKPVMNQPAIELGWSSMTFYEVDQELQESLNVSLPSNSNNLSVAGVYAHLINTASALGEKPVNVTEADILGYEKHSSVTDMSRMWSSRSQSKSMIEKRPSRSPPTTAKMSKQSSGEGSDFFDSPRAPAPFGIKASPASPRRRCMIGSRASTIDRQSPEPLSPSRSSSTLVNSARSSSPSGPLLRSNTGETGGFSGTPSTPRSSSWKVSPVPQRGQRTEADHLILPTSHRVAPLIPRASTPSVGACIVGVGVRGLGGITCLDSLWVMY